MGGRRGGRGHGWVGAKRYAAGEGIRGAGRGGRGLRSPETLDPPKASESTDARQTRARSPGARGGGRDGAAGTALEAQALGAPPLRLDGVAGAVAGIVEHGRGPGGAAARGGHGGRRRRIRDRRSRGIVPPRPNWRGARARVPGRRSEGCGSESAPTHRQRGPGSGKRPPPESESATVGAVR